MFSGKKGSEPDHDVRAFLGTGTEFDGKLVFNGSVRIDGCFKGDIMGGGLLISGEGSRIEGNITVDNIVISGEVHGNLEAKDKVEIDSRGKLFGDMISGVLVIQAGGVFEGNCRMADSPKKGISDGVVQAGNEF